MLLTQSQVSVFFSAVISTSPLPLPSPHLTQGKSNPLSVFFFTLALFLSGYVLQQKTLNNLRAAIRPQQPTAQLYIPTSHKPSLPLHDYASSNAPKDSSLIIEITPTEGGSEDGPLSNAPHRDHQSILASYEKISPILPHAPAPSRVIGVINTANKLIHRWIARVRGDHLALEEVDDEDVPLENLSKAARRRRIKRDIMRLGSGEDVDVSKIYRPRKRAW
jgi:hypothetical protein